MPRSRARPHSLALFSLQPLNDKANAVVEHPHNRCLVSKQIDGSQVLDIGFHIRSRSCSTRTLALLGRGDTDIKIEGSSISKIQCSFEINLDTKVVMLFDRSHGQTTQLCGGAIGQDTFPFEHGRIRKVVVQKHLNEEISMGTGQSIVWFRLIWHQTAQGTIDKVNARESVPQDYVQEHEDTPHLAHTLEELDTVLPSRMQTRPHTSGARQLHMRFRKLVELGKGAFGTVHKAIDVDEGKFLAVKILRRPGPGFKVDEWVRSCHYAQKREVETLSQISHPHIVDYIHSQGWDRPEVEIFMGLKDGNLESLIESRTSSSIPGIADCVFRQMLQALDFLSFKDIKHRDVKPANVLYTCQGDQYQFQLGDFGLCNRALNATSQVGTTVYMAPEIYLDKPQTPKVDVWSLFATMLWTLDVDDFRQKSVYINNHQAAQGAILKAAANITVSKIQEMAIVDPDHRASAAQILVKCFNGEGLSTPQRHVPPLAAVPPEVDTTVGVGHTMPRHQPTRRNRLGTHMTPRSGRNYSHNRVEKLRFKLQK